MMNEVMSTEVIIFSETNKRWEYWFRCSELVHADEYQVLKDRYPDSQLAYPGESRYIKHVAYQRGGTTR